MRSKRLIHVVWIVVALVALSGLASAQTKTKITFWSHTHPPMVELYEKLIAEYEALNPHVDIEYTAVPNNEFFMKMLTAMSTRTGPDVFAMSSTQIAAYLQRGTVAPILPEAFGFSSQEELVASYVGNALNAVTYNGAVYGVPSEFNASALLINTAHFREAGLDPDNPPRTWDEVVEYSRKLTVRDGNRLVRRGFDFYYLPNFYWLDFQNLLSQFGGHILSPDGKTAVLNDEAGVKALTFWYDLVHKEQLAGAQWSIRDSVDTLADFVNGSVSMMIAYPWAIGSLQGSPVWDDVKIVPLPQVNPERPVTHGYAYFWMVSNTAADKLEAWKFVNFLASHPLRWLHEVGFVQPKKGWSDDPKAQEFPFLDVWLDAMSKSDFGDLSPNWAEVSSAIQRAIESSIMNGVAPQRALDQAKREIDAALRQ